jgi:hypothetical protein
MSKNSHTRLTRQNSTIGKSSPREASKGWSKIKSTLTRLRRDALIRLVHDLYNANVDNRAFLHARFGSAEDSLKPYMEAISRWVNPDLMSKQDVSVSMAKKAITDYTKAIGRPEGIAELSVHYCEACADFLKSWPDADVSYLEALIRMFERALKAIEALDPEIGQPFNKRLENIAVSFEDYGYGVIYELDDLMSRYGIYNDDESTDS